MLAFAVGAGLTATLLAAIAPVLAVLGAKPGRSIGDGGRAASAGPAGTRTRQALIVTQFALSLALLMAAALLARTVYNLRAIPTGFDIDHVALAAADPSAARMEGPRATTYFQEAITALERLPGVRAAAFGRVIPLGFGGSRTSITVPGYDAAPDEELEINFNVVSDRYFEATGIALAAGRTFDERDTAGGAPVAVVNETMAARYWGAAGALGRHFVLGPNVPPVRVIGVARDVKYRMLREAPGPSFYLPLAQSAARRGVLHIRTAGDPADLLPAIQRTVAAIDPAVPVTGLRTLRDQATLNLNDERIAMFIGLTLGAAALLLAAVGLYGSMSFAFARRTRELGVRVALGATARDIRGLVLKQGLGLSLAGTLAGAALALLLARAIESRLYGVTGTDLPTLVLSASILTTVGACASWVPARRAARIDPVHALRVE
jgi:predicted permease